MRSSKVSRWGALALAGAMVLGSCTSDSDSSSGDAPADGGTVIEAGWVNETDLEPTTGGELNVTLAAPPPGLDIATGTHGLPTQGPIITAIFDSLLRYDPETGEITGQLAEGITHNEDFTEWTLTLRDDVRFTDGTPLDAAAVVTSLERLGNSRNTASVYAKAFTSIETPDDRTVVLKLDAPLNNVDALFSAELGFISSPTALQERGDGFATNPVGAGPFMVERFDPTAELVLVKNPDYALGDVRIDRIRMTWSADPSASIDKVSIGQSDMVFVGNNPVAVARAINEGLPTYTTLVGGSGFAINNAADRDFPGDDPRVRQAISMAIDPEILNERANDGQGVYGRFLMPPGNRFHVDTPFSKSGADEARTLLDEVKSETGWDGSFTISTEASRHDEALSAQAQLNAVGFNVTVDRLSDFSQMIERTLVNRDFDVSTWVMTTYDTNIYQSLSRSLLSDSASNYMKFSSPQMDEILKRLPATTNADETREVLDDLAQQFQTDQPFLYVGTSPFTTVTTDKIGGMVPTSLGVFLWSEVFKAS